MSLPQQLLETLSALPVPGCYRVAYSGGRDSHVLLHALCGLREKLQAPLSAVHVDHGLQTASPRWAEHCREISRQLQIPLEIIRLALQPEKGRSLEEQARQERYRAFSGLMRPGEMLLMAHHQEDQAETVLLQLLRGAGPAGLAAMPIVVEFGPGYQARPLLAQPRRVLDEYALSNRLIWVEDPSNQETGFDRNYLRREVMPLLTERWPSLARTLARSARHCAEAQGLIDEVAGQDLLRLLKPGGDTLLLSGLVSLSAPKGRAVLRAWIRGKGFQLPNTARLDRILMEMSSAAEERNPLVHWPGVEVRRYRDRLYLMPPLKKIEPHLSLLWDGRTVLELPAGLGRLRVIPSEGGLSLRQWEQGRIQIRFRHQRERLQLSGRSHSQSFKNFFQQQAIPPWQRGRIPFVYIDDQLAAVADLAQCRPFTAGKGERGIQIQWDR
jgi:tRNA(Ile)-lysidine synthase